MKKFITTYAIFSIIVLMLVYLVTFIQETQKRSNDLFFEILNQAIETNDLEEFVKYQSIGFRLDEIIESDDFDIHLYRVIEQENDRYYISFNAFVVPTSDVVFATSITDGNDQSAIEITHKNNGTIIYRTQDDEAFDRVAISYGIDLYGLYFYKVILEDSFIMDLTFYDYEGDVIINQEIDFIHITYDGLILPEGFSPGYSVAEIIEMQNLSQYLVRPMMINIGLYLIIDIATGVLFYWFLKKKQL